MINPWMWMAVALSFSQTSYADSDFDRALAIFDHGTAPELTKMVGWWSGRCYFPGQSGEKTAVGFVLVFPTTKDSSAKETKIMAGRAYGDGSASYFDRLEPQVEQMLQGWTKFEWAEGVPYSVTDGSWHRQTEQAATEGSPEIVYDNYLRIENGRYAFKFVVNGEDDLACMTTRRIR